MGCYYSAMTRSAQILEQIEKAARAFPDHPALADGNHMLTYSLLWEKAISCADLLVATGAAEGQAIGLFFPNSARFVAALLGTARVGCTAILFPPALTSEEFRYYCQAAGTQIVLSTPTFRDRLEAAGGQGLGSEVSGMVPFGFDSSPGDRFRQGDFIGQLTSGVDMPPKLAIRTHVAVWNEIRDFTAEIGVTAQDATLVLSSISHSYGLIGGTLAPLCQGGRVILRDRYTPEEVPQLVARQRATILYAVPVTYRAMVSSPVAGPQDLSSLRLCFSAGAPLLRGTEDQFAERFGRRISQNYGTTEAGVISTRLEWDLRLQGSVGRPLRNRTIQIMDPHGHLLDPGQIGKVVVQSPALARTYLEGPRGVPAPIGDCFATGDLGWMSEDGYLFLAGRTSSMIHLAGLLIDPGEVEEVIGRLPLVREVAVVGVSHPGGERLTAVLVAQGLTASDVVQHCRRYLTEAKIPKIVEFRDALPRTPAGKIIRRVLS